MEKALTEPSVVTEQTPESACSAPPIPADNKTKVIKGFHPEIPAGLVNRATFAFQPVGSTIPLMDMEAATEAKLARVARVDDNPHPAYAETRRRIHVAATQIFCMEWMFNMPPGIFTADWLTKITAYMNALPKPLGYDYVPVLRREAALLIPRTIGDAYDVDEMLRSLFIWRKNCCFLHDPLLIVGLFLLFFLEAQKLNFSRQFRYDLAVDAIMSWKSEVEIREDVNSILHQGLY